MTHWREIPAAVKVSRADAVAWLATSVLTVVVDLAMAIAVGMLFSIYLYVRRPSRSW